MYKSIEFVYFSLVIVALSLSLVRIISTGHVGGEFEEFELTISLKEVFFIYAVNVTFLLIGFHLYFYYIKKKIKKTYFLKFRERSAAKVIFILLIAQIIFTIKTGVGVVGSVSESVYSFIFVLISPVPVFYIYYFLARRTLSKLFFCNVALFSLLQLIQGWSSFIMLLFFCELYFRFENNPSRYLKIICKAYIFIPFFFIVGALVYKVVLPIKNEVRGSGGAAVTYSESMFALSSRLSFLSASLAAYQNVKEVKAEHEREYIELREAKSLFRPLLPTVIMGEKDFRSFNNIYIQTYYEGLNKYTGAGVGVPTFLYMLYMVDGVEFISYILLFLILIVVVRLFFSMLEQFPGQLNFIFYVFLMRLYVGGSLEVGFAYGVLNGVYFIGLLILFRVLLLRKV
jgi:hypothetical protein